MRKNFRQFYATILALGIIAAFAAGCQSEGPASNIDQTGGDTTLVEVDEEAARLQRIRENNVLEPVGELTEKSGFSADFPSVNMGESFSTVKAWTSDTSPAYIVIGTLKDTSLASDLSTSLITDLFELTNLVNSDVQVESASCGEYFIMAGAENATDIVDKFTEVLSCLPVSSVDEIFHALQEKVAVPDVVLPAPPEVVEPEGSGSIANTNETTEKEPNTEPDVPSGDVPGEVFWPGYPYAIETGSFITAE